MNDGAADLARLALARALAERRSGALHLNLDPAGAAHDGAQAGWRVVLLRGTDTRAAFLRQCAYAFELPDWFGLNWDALADALSDVQHRPGTFVIWVERDGLPQEVRRTADQIFAERADDGPAPFLVLTNDER